jgi:hypothetical protein
MENGEKVPWDFKLNARTMLMAPGTVMPKGVYRAGVWMPPPILDIRYLAPELEIFKSEGKPFLIDQRPHQSRVIRAMSYLKHAAPLSIEGQGRRKALRAVAEHLVVDLDLDPSLAFHLMTETKAGKDKQGNAVVHVAWNERCRNAAGKPAPWSDDALWQALEDAVDAVPLHGVLLHQEAEEKEFARWSAAGFIEIMTHLPEPKGDIQITKDTLYRGFLEFSGVKPETFQKCELGLEINRAIAQGRLPFVEDHRSHTGRFYRGLDQNTLRMAMDTSELLNKAYRASS